MGGVWNSSSLEFEFERERIDLSWSSSWSGSSRMDEHNFQYRKLIVWQKAMQFARQVYSLIEHFPISEKYALSD